MLGAHTPALFPVPFPLPLWAGSWMPPDGGWDVGAGGAHVSQALVVGAVSLFCGSLWAFQKLHPSGSTPSFCRAGRALRLSMAASSEPARKECGSALQGKPARTGFRCLSKQIGDLSLFVE